MALDFPVATTVGQTFTDPGSGSVYVVTSVGPPAIWVGSGSSTNLDSTYYRKDGSNAGTAELKMPTGTTAQRTTTPASAGFLRFNTTDTRFEGWNGTAWTPVGAGAVGGGTDSIFFENGQTVNTNYTISTGKNAMSAGPITIASGVTVTVPSGQTWTIV